MENHREGTEWKMCSETEIIPDGADQRKKTLPTLWPCHKPANSKIKGGYVTWNLQKE